MNTYGYVGGNPLSYVDPYGLAASTLLRPLASGLGALAACIAMPEQSDFILDQILNDLADDLKLLKGLNDLLTPNLLNEEGDVEEEYDSLDAAVGEVNPLDDVEYEGKTKKPGLREQGFTEKWSGVDSNGDIQTAFKNPKTGKWTGGHPSSKNDKYW